MILQPEHGGFVYPALGCRLLGQSTRRTESGQSSGVHWTIGTITSPKGEQRFLPSEVQAPWGSCCCHCACQALRHQRTAWGPELMRRDEHTGESPFSLSIGDHFPSLGAGFRGSLRELTLSILWLSAGAGCIEFRTGKQMANLAPVWWFCEVWLHARFTCYIYFSAALSILARLYSPLRGRDRALCVYSIRTLFLFLLKCLCVVHRDNGILFGTKRK